MPNSSKMRTSKARSWIAVTAIAGAAASFGGPAGAAAAPPPCVPNVFTVDSAADVSAAGRTTLRDAVALANTTPNTGSTCPDAIEFAIPGTGVHAINLQRQLPRLSEPVNVRGYTQPGSAPATATTAAAITIWIDADLSENGLVVKTDDSSISGLAIGNAGQGVGSTLPADDGHGIKVLGDRNRIRGNDIGTHQQVAAPPPGILGGSISDGIYVEGDDNQVGSQAAEDRNVVAASGSTTAGGYGVRVEGDHNRVRGNTIGTDPEVTDPAVGNRAGGVYVSGTLDQVGGTAAGAGNTIAGNAGPAIDLASTTTNALVAGNTVGTELAGFGAYGNSRGIVVEEGSTGNAIGTTGATGGNVVVGTFPSSGIELAGDKNLVLHNTVGLDAAQAVAISNVGGGIRVTGNLNIIGGDATDAGNVVAGNDSYGIQLDDGAAGNVFWGNRIGTNAAAADDLGNTSDGIQIVSGGGNVIGGSGGNGLRPNVIADNTGAGVAVQSGTDNAIVQNSIYDNDGLGIDLGNDDAVQANDPGDTDSGPNGLQNYPLITSVRTPLSPKPPQLLPTTVNWTASDFRVDPLATTEIDFYESPSCEADGTGEGKTLVATALLGAGALPDTATHSTTLPWRVPQGDGITATATTSSGGPLFPGRTSEFSACFTAPAPSFVPGP